MTDREYQEIRNKFQTLETQASKAEGAKEQLLISLKTGFDLSSVEEGELYLEALDKEISNLDKEIEEVKEELASVTDWGKV